MSVGRTVPQADSDDPKQYARDIGPDREKFAGCSSRNVRPGVVQPPNNRR